MKTKMYNTKSSFNLESIRRLTRTIFRMSMMVFVLFFISSDIEDGMDGIDGIAGIARTDGIDGEQGSAGTIGNANVRTFTFNTSSAAGSNFTIPFAELTQDVLDIDVVLTYIQRAVNLRYSPIPGISVNNALEVELYIGNIDIYSYARTTGASLVITAGEYSLVKVIIIEPSSTTTGK